MIATPAKDVFEADVREAIAGLGQRVKLLCPRALL